MTDEMLRSLLNSAAVRSLLLLEVSMGRAAQKLAI